MHLNVLDDLAEAMKALDGKKSQPSGRVGSMYSLFFPSNAFMASARSFNTLYGIAKAVISN